MPHIALINVAHQPRTNYTNKIRARAAFCRSNECLGFSGLHFFYYYHPFFIYLTVIKTHILLLYFEIKLQFEIFYEMNLLTYQHLFIYLFIWGKSRREHDDEPPSRMTVPSETVTAITPLRCPPSTCDRDTKSSWHWCYLRDYPSGNFPYSLHFANCKR